jgi:hypothetical protein
VQTSLNILYLICCLLDTQISKQMKYTITRQFALKKQKFEVISDSKVVCKVKAVESKTYKDQFK